MNRMEIQINSLELRVGELYRRVGDVQRVNFIVVPVRSLGDEPYELTCEIPIVVQATGNEGDDFVASYFDAGVSASGDTDQEAVDNLKAYIVDLFKLLEVEEDKLGPKMRKQLVALRKVIRKRVKDGTGHYQRTCLEAASPVR